MDEETRFILYLEWDALRSAIAQYLGIEDKEIDSDRCRISGINYDEKGMEIAMVILPPERIAEDIALQFSRQVVVSLQQPSADD